MVLDIAVNSDLDTEYDAVGDAAVVRGVDYIRQTVFVSAVEFAQTSAPALTPEAIEEQRSNIESAIRANPHTEEPIDVTVRERSIEDDSITYDVRTARVSLPVEIIQ